MENIVIDSLKLRSKIVGAGHTYRSLAEKINMTPNAIAILIKKKDTKVSTLYKICNAVNCTIDEVLIKD